MRHGGDHLLVHRHLLFDRPLHTDQPDPELVLKQFTNRTNPAVSEMIDVIHLTDVFTQLQQIRNDGIKICGFQDALLQRRRQIQLDVELQPADPRKIVLARVEEHSFE